MGKLCELFSEQPKQQFVWCYDTLCELLETVKQDASNHAQANIPNAILDQTDQHLLSQNVSDTNLEKPPEQLNTLFKH